MDKFPETVDDFLSGQILLINKPLGWTSFDVVRKIKNLIRTKYNLKKIKVERQKIKVREAPYG